MCAFAHVYLLLFLKIIIVFNSIIFLHLTTIYTVALSRDGWWWGGGGGGM